jgi:hypothetical protein
VTADDEGLNLGGSLAGDRRLYVAQVAHDVEAEGDAVAASIDWMIWVLHGGLLARASRA